MKQKIPKTKKKKSSLIFGTMFLIFIFPSGIYPQTKVNPELIANSSSVMKNRKVYSVITKIPKNVIKNNFIYAPMSNYLTNDNRFIPYIDSIKKLQDSKTSSLFNKDNDRVSRNRPDALTYKSSIKEVKVSKDKVPQIIILLLFITIFFIYQEYLTRKLHLK